MTLTCHLGLPGSSHCPSGSLSFLLYKEGAAGGSEPQVGEWWVFIENHYADSICTDHANGNPAPAELSQNVQPGPRMPRLRAIPGEVSPTCTRGHTLPLYAGLLQRNLKTRPQGESSPQPSPELAHCPAANSGPMGA